MNAIPTATTSAATSSAPAGGNSGVGATATPPMSPFHALAAMLAEEPQPGVTATNEAPPASGTDAPPESVAGAANEDGQPVLPPETTPSAGEKTPAGENDSPNLPSDPKPKPEVTKATQKRIDELTAEKYRLRDENEALKTKLSDAEKPASPAAHSPGPQNLPESVAKLRTVADVEARQGQLETLVDGLQDFLDANPGEPETVYDAQTQKPVNLEADGRRYLSRAQIIAERAQARAELKALPKRAAQITQSEHLRTAQTQMQTELAKDFPHLSDPENPETQLYQAALAAYAFHPGAPLIALKLARGHQVIEAERQARTNGNGHVKPLFGGAGQRPAPLPGQVPVRQPGTAGGSAAVPAPARANVQAALDRNRKEGSRESLAALIAAGGL